MANTIIIKELFRKPYFGEEDTLEFKPGVNLIIGPGNSGKTKWLNMLDYLLGDPGKVEEAFPQNMVDKFDSVGACVIINGNEYTIERRWKENNSKGKVFIENEGITTEDFQKWLLEKLEIPLLHFPKGNPYDERAWPELSWRVLYRHIYRQQRFWADIADKQPQIEQYAAIVQFLGIAQYLYSGKSGELVEKRKELWKTKGAKDQFLLLLDKITHEVTDDEEIQKVVTEEFVENAIKRKLLSIENLQKQRELILSKLQESSKEIIENNIDIDYLSHEWAKNIEEKLEKKEQFAKAESRLDELEKYFKTINIEISKLERAQKAGDVLSDLKVTNCPVCDQPLSQKATDDSHCSLCGKSVTQHTVENSDRIEMEMKRLKGEKQEVLELIKNISIDRDQLIVVIRSYEENIRRLESQLQPIRKSTSAIIPPELGITDMEKGRLQESIRQLERIKVALDYQKQLSKIIDDLSTQIDILEGEMKIETSRIRFEYSSDLLSEGMTSYLFSLESEGKKLWKHARITANIRDRYFHFLINNEEWTTKLGGTSILYFLLSYHYGLLSLTHHKDCHYPGLLILDLPATFIDGSSIRDKENFIAESFISLVNKPNMEDLQIIITGQSFDGLDNVNRINFSKIWE